MLYISTGGLSTLERAFDILGWNDPHPVPECECEVPGCHEYANCGTPTKDGYKRVCGKHFAELTHKEAEAALANVDRYYLEYFKKCPNCGSRMDLEG